MSSVIDKIKSKSADVVTFVTDHPLKAAAIAGGGIIGILALPLSAMVASVGVAAGTVGAFIAANGVAIGAGAAGAVATGVIVKKVADKKEDKK